MECGDNHRAALCLEDSTSCFTRPNGEYSPLSVLNEGHEDRVTPPVPTVPRSGRASPHPDQGSTDSQESLTKLLVPSTTQASDTWTRGLPSAGPTRQGASKNEAAPPALESTPTPSSEARRQAPHPLPLGQHQYLHLRLPPYAANPLLCHSMVPRRPLRVPQLHLPPHRPMAIDHTLPPVTHHPKPDDGVMMVHDVSHATRILLDSGPRARSIHPCVAVFDSGSPQTYIQQSVWERMLTSNAANASAVCLTADHNWPGFDECTSLRANFSLRLSIQFMRSKTHTAKIAVWAFLTPDRTMARLVLMGHDSWLRFNHRIYVTLHLPDDHPHNPMLRKLP